MQVEEKGAPKHPVPAWLARAAAVATILGVPLAILTIVVTILVA